MTFLFRTGRSVYISTHWVPLWQKWKSKTEIGSCLEGHTPACEESGFIRLSIQSNRTRAEKRSTEWSGHWQRIKIWYFCGGTDCWIFNIWPRCTVFCKSANRDLCIQSCSARLRQNYGPTERPDSNSYKSKSWKPCLAIICIPQLGVCHVVVPLASRHAPAFATFEYDIYVGFALQQALHSVGFSNLYSYHNADYWRDFKSFLIRNT